MEIKLTSKKATGIIGALLFIISLMISHVPENATANDSSTDTNCEIGCTGSGIQCASHIPCYFH